MEKIKNIIKMPNHRMFSYRIANSAKFLQMPAEAQLLYFHMILRADDDGVVEAYPLLKLLGTPADVFKVLIAKEFIIKLNEDQVVVIKEWLEHNKIRADRKINSIYKNLLDKQNIEILAPKPRSDVKNNSKRLFVDRQWTDNGQTMDSISQVKSSQVKSSKVKLSNIDSDVSNFFKIRNNKDFKDKYFLKEKTKNFFLKAEMIFNDNPSAFFECIGINKRQVEKMVSNKEFLSTKKDVILKAYKKENKIKNLPAYIWKVYEEFSDGR